MEIDPIETIIQWLKEALTIVAGRVAGKHRYGAGWAQDESGVSVHGDGGAYDVDAKISKQRLELRIYADGTVNVTNVWRALVSLSRENERFEVLTSNGNALVHCFYPESGLSLVYDEVLKKDLGVVFFQTEISEEAVP